MPDRLVLDQQKEEIRARLVRVCSHMSHEMFEDLVNKIAHNQQRATQRDTHNWAVGEANSEIFQNKRNRG